MILRLGVAIIGCIAVGLVAGAGSAFAFGPINVNVAGDARSVVDVSFFGRPYPYGYTSWGPCVRYVEVETRWGPRLRRVRVCR
jgi:hypothetical protein